VPEPSERFAKPERLVERNLMVASSARNDRARPVNRCAREGVRRLCDARDEFGGLIDCSSFDENLRKPAVRVRNEPDVLVGHRF